MDCITACISSPPATAPPPAIAPHPATASSPPPVRPTVACALQAAIETGQWGTAFSRWAFKESKGKCLKFLFGGFRANADIFTIQQECQNKCSVSRNCTLWVEGATCMDLMYQLHA